MQHWIVRNRTVWSFTCKKITYVSLIVSDT